MKKIYTLVGATLMSAAAFAQVSFSDDFESYNVGDYIGTVSPEWTTWSGANGGTEDTQVNNALNHTSGGSKSVKFTSTSSTGGPQDQVLPFGGQYNTGTFSYTMYMFVETSKGAYFNFQGNTAIGTLYAMECYMNQLGEMYMTNTNGLLAQTTYPMNTWFELRYDINLNTNSWVVSIDNVQVASFANTVNQIASIDIFPVNSANYGGNNQSSYYVDDVSFSYTPYVLPAVNAGVIAVGSKHPATRQPAAFTGFVGQQKKLAATVRNLGTNAITSFDISYTYNSNTVTQTVSSVNIASLASYMVEFTAPVALIVGNNPIVYTVSNVNGAGADNDANDDMSTYNANITVVPAPNRVVVGEEGTGTWCQWCPRGAVYMDYMAETYDGYFAGVAVHNGDPMTVPSYDASFSALISGYPSSLVDRGGEVDPSAMEPGFLQRLTIPGHANISTGAQVSGTTLNVSLTYTFTQAANSSYKVICLLLEDSVTGTGSSYSQSNAYNNNSAGPMGGFESLPASVSFNIMNYNHVARALSPSFTGAPNVFPATVNVGNTFTFNFTFTVPAGWDQSQMHIVGILIDPQGSFDNAGEVTLAQAITNGFVSGTPITGVQNQEPAFTEALNLYPNPATDMAYANITLSQPEEVIMTITDITGKVVATRNYGELTGNNLLPINTTEFADGIYLVEVRTATGVSTSKLIVQ
jgi:Outer membrane protein Omp28/Secretion system C-terminal sorting domain